MTPTNPPRELHADDPVLCYIDEPWAYFTTQALEDQWGDDWDDAPYEHNAEAPYEDWGMYEEGKPQWRIVKIALDGPFETPSDAAMSCSVQEINRGDVAWLIPSWAARDDVKPIPAGTPLSEFKRLVKAAGGTIYIPEEE